MSVIKSIKPKAKMLIQKKIDYEKLMVSNKGIDVTKCRGRD